MNTHRTTHRRGLATLGGVLSMVLFLAGCMTAPDQTTDSEPTTQGNAESSLLPAAEGATDYPLMLETPFGETELTERPERIAIVTAGTVDTDALIALGGTPVFAPSTLERNAWLDSETLESIDVLWTSENGAEPSAEQVAASEPDLIVSLAAYDTFDQARFDQYSAIAPVLYTSINDELTWQETIRALGEVLDLSDTAEEIVAETEDVIAAVAKDHPEFAGKTATFVIVFPQEDGGATYRSAPGSSSAELFLDLGFVLPENASQFADDWAISDELISLIDADVLLVSYAAGTDAAYFTESPLYLAVPAVADGRVAVYEADASLPANPIAWGLASPSALSLPWVVDTVAELSTQALN